MRYINQLLAEKHINSLDINDFLLEAKEESKSYFSSLESNARNSAKYYGIKEDIKYFFDFLWLPEENKLVLKITVKFHDKASPFIISSLEINAIPHQCGIALLSGFNGPSSLVKSLVELAEILCGNKNGKYTYLLVTDYEEGIFKRLFPSLKGWKETFSGKNNRSGNIISTYMKALS